ncbi:MAG: NADPH-dependent FMN reductase [Myxococcota bacterium]
MTLTVAAIAGSLRADSLNRKLLRAATARLPEGTVVNELSIDLPLFNTDIDKPDSVKAFSSAIGAADGVLIATPEYNYGIPGPLKNAIDWASRPAYQSVFARKKVGILGASMGASGTIRAQAHLKNVLMGMVAIPFCHPEYALGAAHTKFDGETLADTRSAELLEGYIEGFVGFLQG